jgi:hypothetical protein
MPGIFVIHEAGRKSIPDMKDNIIQGIDDNYSRFGGQLFKALRTVIQGMFFQMPLIYLKSKIK